MTRKVLLLSPGGILGYTCDGFCRASKIAGISRNLSGSGFLIGIGCSVVDSPNWSEDQLGR